MYYDKNVLDLIMLVVDNSTFKDGVYAGVPLEISLKSYYPTMELSFNDKVSFIHRDKLLEATNILKENKDLSNLFWFKQIAIVIASLDVRHNNKCWKETLIEFGLDLPLSNDLLKFFLISRQTNTIYKSYLYIDTSFSSSVNVDYKSKEFLFLPEYFKLNDDFENLRLLIKSLFNYDDLREHIKNELNLGGLWFNKLLCGLLFELNYSKDIAIGYMSNMASYWACEVNKQNSNFMFFYGLDCTSIILDNLFNSNDVLVGEVNNFHQRFIEDFCLFDEKKETMFLDNLLYEKLKNNRNLFSQFIEDCPAIKREYIKRKLHTDSSECSSFNLDDFKV